MSRQLADRMHHNYCVAMGHVLLGVPGARSEHSGGMVLIDAGVGEGSYGAALFDPAPEHHEQFQEARDWFAQRRLRHRMLLRSGYDDEGIATALQLGYSARASEPALSVEVAGARSRRVPGLRLRKVAHRPDLVTYAGVEPLLPADRDLLVQIAEHASTVPGCILLLGEYRGQPAARAMAMVCGDVVGVYNVFVREEHRRRGLGRAITWAAIDAGCRAGASLACLQATDAGLALYTNMGFKPVYDLVTLDSPPIS